MINEGIGIVPRELFPEPLASKIEHIDTNSRPHTLLDDQATLHTIETFYSFGFDQSGINERLPKKTLFVEAIFAIGFLSAAGITEDYAVFLPATAILTSLFIVDCKLYVKDVNKHAGLTDDGKRRKYIKQLREQINER